MNIQKVTLFLCVTLLTACASPTAEQSVSAWVGGEAQAKTGDSDPGAFLKSRFKSDQTLDERDYLMIQQTLRHALEYAPDGRVSAWKNPASGNKGTLIITSTGVDKNARPARTYKMVVQTSRGSQTFEGESRREADGTWAPSFQVNR